MEVVKEAMRLAFADRQLDRLDGQECNRAAWRQLHNKDKGFSDGLLVLALSRGNVDGLTRMLAARTGVPRELVAFKVANFQCVEIRLLCRAAGVAGLHTNILIDMLRVARRRRIALRPSMTKDKSWKKIALAVLDFYRTGASPLDNAAT